MMSSIEQFGWSLYPYIPIAIFVGVALAGVEMYRLWRDRLVMKWNVKDGPSSTGGNEDNATDQPSVAISGVNADGELTTAAKYAIWNYMFGLLAIGGAVIGVLSGVAGYMIKDLATKNALQSAFIQMQKPLTEHMDKFATADAALKAAYTTATSKSDFPGQVAKTLIEKHQDELRGKPGADGKNGVDGKDAVAPSVAAMAVELAQKHNDELRGKPGRDGVAPSVSDVAQELAAKYSDQLRGKPGVDGKNGVDGRAGTDAVAPSATAVADELFKKYGAEFRGKDGVPGKDGMSPTVAAIVAGLMATHRQELRGESGKDGVPGRSAPGVAEIVAVLVAAHVSELRGKPGDNGKNGRDGKDGVSPDLNKIAELVVNQFGDRLRGKDGKSPTAAEVAAAVWDGHRDEIRPPQTVRRRHSARGTTRPRG